MGIALSASACAQSGAPDVTPDISATARLDRDAMQVALPVDDYSLDHDSERTIDQARHVVMRTCLNAKGVNGLPPTTSSGPAEERPYGLWNAEHAAQNGYSMPSPTPTDAPPLGGHWNAESDPAFNAAYDACRETVSRDLASITPPETERTTAMDIRDDAFALASATPEWKEARKQWHDCLTARGLTPRTDDNAWSSEQGLGILTTADPENPSPADKREEVRIAVIEASCNEQTQLTQKLGDLEAGFQAALIKGKEAQLTQEKADNQKYVDAARAYLASHQ
ncbi:hypothetical protein KZX06_04770 [Micrococcus sp. EYE_162]|uniref:hypothetical protein n=1 Tax=unclassified Micrococcus TaxID=2620948 RepID=UPI002003A2B3|nr:MULTISPECIES: hypothetical protein [unclassified Micrococcus]MCK6095373.1 hypothetical protein [Micrococcus sp. EYE_212]MCK6171355.1 hypothetical protein [Micrococcus sp. EYE_162]